MNASKKEKINILNKLISLLDRPNYVEYSNGKSNNYLDYISKSHSDEISLIHPIIFSDFATQILGFTPGVNLFEEKNKNGKRPDFVPDDRLTHPFIFDTKGTDTSNLHQHYSQIRGYIKTYRIKYGILINMRDVDVYTVDSDIEIKKFNFNFILLYKSYKEKGVSCLEDLNTKIFFDFVYFFSYKKLSHNAKLNTLMEMPPFTGEEILDSEHLLINLKKIIEKLILDVNLNKNNIFKYYKSNEEKNKIEIELQTIQKELSIENFDNESLYSLPQFINGLIPFLEKPLSVYLNRVAYFTLTKIILVRVWGDLNFIDKNLLYNGDLKETYNKLNRNINFVLKEAFLISAKKYPTLFEAENNYTWYFPNTDILIDILYLLGNFNLGKLNEDLLGKLYENYVDNTDKKNKGQYYTPHPIVSLIWDLVGFNSENALWSNKNKNEFIKVFDPCVGSGSFLVEYTKRIVRQLSSKKNKLKLSTFNKLIDSIYGSEISSFPFYITEINLLIQLTHFLSLIINKEEIKKLKYELKIINNNTLQFHYSELNLFKEDSEVYKENLNSILPSHIEKRNVFDIIKYEDSLDYCCSNPPYVAEQKNSSEFKKTLNQYPFWKKYYMGKMDYSYFFIILGLSKLKEGGKLCFITQNSWLGASGAEKLRKYIYENSKILMIVDLNIIDVFDTAKGQENMIFVLQKCKNKNGRENNNIKLIQYKKNAEKISVSKVSEMISQLFKKESYENEYINIFNFHESQSYLKDKKWSILLSNNKRTKTKTSSNKYFKLGEFFNVDIGVDTGANKVDKAKLNKYKNVIPNININEGIYLLSQNEMKSIISILNPYEKEKLIKIVNYRNLVPYSYINADIDTLLYIKDNDEIEKLPYFYSHLTRLKPLLENRAEIKRNKNREWWGLAWPRPGINFKDFKIICPTRSPATIFSLIKNKYGALSNAILIQPKYKSKYSLLFLLGILNSNKIREYCNSEFKRVQNRYVYSKEDVSNIPIPRIQNDKDIKNIELFAKEIFELVNSIVKENKILSKDEFNKYLISNNNDISVKKFNLNKNRIDSKINIYY